MMNIFNNAKNLMVRASVCQVDQKLSEKPQLNKESEPELGINMQGYC